MSKNQLTSNLKTFWLKNKKMSSSIIIAMLAIAVVGGLILFNIFKPKEAEVKTNSETQNSSVNQATSNENPINQDLVPNSSGEQPTTNTLGKEDKPTGPTPPVITNLPIR